MTTAGSARNAGGANAVPELSTVDHLAQLIAFDTTSARSNLALIDYVERHLACHGVDCRRVANAQGDKANLYATIGPAQRRGVMLSGHTDTVPVAGQTWQYDPYALTACGERLYGRGTADMKGFLASVLAAVPAMAAADLSVPINLAFSYDEEVGCLGVRGLIADMAQYPQRPVACVVGEPTSMRVCCAHKGKLAARVRVRGKACHSGMALEGVNAIHAAARLIGWIEQAAAGRAKAGPFDERFGIPHTTLQVGTVEGGAALNIVPAHCQFDFEIRNVPAEDPQRILQQFLEFAAALEAELRQGHADACIEVERLSSYPGLSSSQDSALVAFVMALLDDAAIERIGFGTEGGLFQGELGIPTLVCGPGSMAQGHRPDEFVTGEQLERCDAFLQRLIAGLEQPGVGERLADGGVS
ncbi:acetylornithine deacetylase [Salinisphaera sp. T5B8]|uniref:acetylornithine deacetylase n=1 Tax=Salinisphaera sp. T5B8 TaxID=1304154 RepID=UPI003341D2CE